MPKLASTKSPSSREQPGASPVCARGTAIAAGASGGGCVFPDLGICSASGILEDLYLWGSYAVHLQDASPILGIAGRLRTPKSGTTGSHSVLLSVGYEDCASLALNLIRGRVPGSPQSLEMWAITGVHGVSPCGQSRVLPPQGCIAVPDQSPLCQFAPPPLIFPAGFGWPATSRFPRVPGRARTARRSRMRQACGARTCSTMRAT